MPNKRGRPISHFHKYRYDESLGKWFRKKRYKHPVITMLKLDPEQALLVACMVGGGYFLNTTSPRGACHARGALSNCAVAVRGRFGRSAPTQAIDTFPS